jgi:recombinational DNA repair protein RecT
MGNEITKNNELQSLLTGSLDLKIIQSRQAIDSLINLGYTESNIQSAVEGVILQLSGLSQDVKNAITGLSVYTCIRNALSFNLDCNKQSGEAYFIPYGKAVKQLQLIIGYKAFRNKAYDNGFKIESDVVTQKELNDGDFKIVNSEYIHNTLNRTLDNIIPTMPTIKTKAGSVDFIKEIQAIKEYKDSDIRFVYAKATDIKNGTQYFCKLSIVEVFEKSMKVKRNDQSKKMESKYLSDGLLLKALNNDQDRETDVVKMFQKAAIRAIFTELPNSKLVKYAIDVDQMESKDVVVENDIKKTIDHSIFETEEVKEAVKEEVVEEVVVNNGELI